MDSIMHNKVYICFICNKINSGWIDRFKGLILHGKAMYIQKKVNKLPRKINFKGT